MSHIKRLLFISLILMVMSPVYAQNSATITPLPCEEPGQLTMWVWDEVWEQIIVQAIEDWKADYCPGAEVELVQMPWAQYWSELEVAADTGDLPDIFNMSQDRFYFYADKDALLNLQPYWDDAEVDTTTWGTGIVDPYRWGDNGDLFAGPVNWDTIAIFYNKDLFDAAGLDYPTEEWTWYEFADAAGALTDPANDVYGAAVYSEYQAGYPNWIASTGTTPIVDAERTSCTLQSPGSVEALTFLKDLYDNGYMPSVSDMGGSSADDAFNYWADGHVAMVTAGSWKLSPQTFEQIPFNWDVVRLPRHPDTGISRPILHAVGYVAAANTEAPDLAGNLILYLVSDEGQQFFADAGSVAPANPALQQQWVDSFGEIDVDINAFVNALPDSQGVTVFSEIWDSINTELVVNMFGEGMSVDEATQQACDFIFSQLPE